MPKQVFWTYTSAAHGSLPRQFGAGEMVVVMDHMMLQTGYGLPPSCTSVPSTVLTG